MHATRIIAIRHGETAWNVDTRIQGQLDIGLNETGRQQARRVARALADESIQAIYASDLRRAWDTAHAIASATGGALHAHKGLRERGFGVFQGKTFPEIEAAWPEQARHWRKRDPHWAPEGGESLAAMHQRITRTANELAARHLGEQIVLVAHGGVLDMLYRAATGQDLQVPRSWEVGNAAINRLLWTPDGLTLVGWSDKRHLDDDESLDETTA
ncbi:MAG: histidine phosphatase family protein [Rhodoferax sp.]